MTVTLRELTDDELAAWIPEAIDSYAGQMVEHAGVDPETARTKARTDTDALLPRGERPAEQLVFAVETDGERVGALWCGRSTSDGRPVLWVYAIEIDPGHRGHGYGRAAMELAEGQARRLGLGRIALNVFGGNQTARSLYRSLGYVDDAVWMSKGV